MIPIDEEGDLVIKVVQFDDSILVPWNGEPIVLREEDFLVKKQVINKHSRTLGMLLARHSSSGRAAETFTIKDDSIASMEICFRTIHDASTLTSMVPLEEIWHLTAAGIKYDLDGKMLFDWFGRWYQWFEAEHATNLLCRELLYPCWRFNHARGFLEATRVAIYRNVGPVMERNPTKHYECHLPSRVIQQMNAAKGRLRTELHRMTFEPIRHLLNATCHCKEKTLFQYVKALHSTGVWPLDPVWPKNSVNDILTRLNKFSYKPPPNACGKFCQRNYEKDVGQAISHVREYFDGLCLDCMDKSMPKTRDYDTDYWYHNRLEKRKWNRGCRVEHGQATWYFSFMGRKEDQERFLKDHKIRPGS